jgi:hypothetical protein
VVAQLHWNRAAYKSHGINQLGALGLQVAATVLSAESDVGHRTRYRESLCVVDGWDRARVGSRLDRPPGGISQDCWQDQVMEMDQWRSEMVANKVSSSQASFTDHHLQINNASIIDS